MKKKKISEINLSAQSWFTGGVNGAIFKSFPLAYGVEEYILLHQKLSLRRISTLVVFDKITSYARSLVSLISTGRVMPNGDSWGYSSNNDVKLFEVVYQGSTYIAAKKPDTITIGNVVLFIINGEGVDPMVVNESTLSGIVAL
ncbi:hypothetical protein SAMN05216357_11090 [Porphyromonadaceae bacterium KH3CP3RA]|nr:hypothetical protein SAMN05216357_11090 [Porphyromonadaceae bacterium KH3CP3RA]